MAASVNDHFNESTTNARPVAATTTAIKTIGAPTLTVDSLADWPTDTAVHFTMFEIDANNKEVANTRTDWKAIKTSATTLGTLTLQAGTDREYPIGSKVICAPTAAWADDLVEGLLVSHDQDGTLKADSVDVTAVIKDGVITNAKLVDGTITEAKTNTKPSEFLADFIYSGGTVAQSAGLVGTFSDIVYYIAGVRYTATSVANKTYTASKDTYVDINSSGTPTYTEVANGAASPALTSGYIRVAKVVTNGSAITSVVQAGSDSLGNLIYPNNSLKDGAWRSWTPTWTNVTVGNGTLTANYTQIGKTVLFHLKLVFGSTTAISGEVVFSSPTNISSGYTESLIETIGGAATLRDQSTAQTRPGLVLYYSSTQLALRIIGASDELSTAINATTPWTWTTSDKIMISGTYEAA